MIVTNSLSVGYDDKTIVKNVNLNIKKGSIVSIIGPNGSGKSTLLKSVARLLKHQSGSILFGGKDMCCIKTKEIAQRMSVLSQTNITPDDMTVKRLVEYGRLPHRKWYETASSKDIDIIQWALKQTNMEKFEDRRLCCLSGGERQRAWISMALAQKPDVLLLDEPTTYLDISHQYEVMNLVERLNKKLGVTVIMVLHDLNQAIRYSDEIYALKKGQVVASGSAEKVLTAENIKNIYSLEVDIIEGANAGHSLIVPKAENTLLEVS